MLKRIAVLSAFIQMLISTSKAVLCNESGYVDTTDPNPPVTDQTKTEPPVVDLEKSKKEWLRELSQDLNINAFDPKEVKAKFDKMKEWEEAQKSEQEKLQEQIQSYQTKELEWQTKQREYDSKLKAMELGIDSTKLDDALKLAGNDPEQLTEVIKKYPMFVSNAKNGSITIGVNDPNQNTPPGGLTEAQQYLESKYKDNPYYRGYKK